LDVNALAALFDPQRSKDDGVQRLYRQISIRSYDVSSAQGVRMRIDGFDRQCRRAAVNVQLTEFLSAAATAERPHCGAVA
jgi:hypothetical protein